MADQLIICPSCKSEITLSEALRHQIEETVILEEKTKHLKELEKMKKDLSERTKIELQDLEKQLLEKQSKVEEMQKFELELRKQKREVEEEKKQLKLEVERQLDEQRKEIEKSVTKQILDEHRLKEAEKDKLISDLKVALEDAQKKASQGSQQSQGEVLELEIENQLRNAFPLDNISEIKKGIRGADILQEVIDRNGRVCGRILWETKNAEWQGSWPTKLREDQRASKADLAALVSVNVPESINSFVFQDNIWICTVDCFLALAYALRFNLIQVQQIKMSAASKGETKDELYDYITGLEFKHRVEAMVESFNNLLDDIEKEKRWFAAKWSRQEKSLRTLLDQTGSFHGELESIIGAKLPPVKNFTLDDGEDAIIN